MLSMTEPLAELTAPSRHIFLSPHYDDIALSAGGTVRLLADEGKSPEIVIVFGAEPDHTQPLSPFAEAMHGEWGFTASEVIARRQTEERAAAALLGAQHQVLPFRDAIYREHHYLSDDDLFGDPADAERELPGQIAAALGLPEQPDPDVRIYGPLAVGRHVDHQLVFQAAALLAGQGWDVCFYEDIPYVLKPGAFDARLADVAATTSIEPVARIPIERAWETKIDAILRYPSQLEMVFVNYVGVGASRDEINAALQEYARRAGEGVLVERFWNITDAPSRTGS
jgi:LmbE family N-acetylglucosaminyl deacetylase